MRTLEQIKKEVCKNCRFGEPEGEFTIEVFCVKLSQYVLGNQSCGGFEKNEDT